MQRVIFESSPWFVFSCVAVGVAYAFVMYSAKHPWSKNLNRILFGLRAASVFFLCLLLLGPIVKQITNQVEKPVFILLQDHSQSVSLSADSTARQKIEGDVTALKNQLEQQGYEVARLLLDGTPADEGFKYSATRSDLGEAIRKSVNQFEGRKVAGVSLFSDGIYNSGVSPLYTTYRVPVYTVGIGDTTVRNDIAINEISYNKVVYQGNRFPLRVEVQVNGFSGDELTVRVLKGNRELGRQSKKAAAWNVFDFEIPEEEQGLQRYVISVNEKPGEFNKKNNQATAYIEVVKGKKKIALLASAPHPDIKAIRSVVEQNQNYELITFIPGVNQQSPDLADMDLVILHQAPDRLGKMNGLFQQASASKAALFVLVAPQTDVSMLTKNNILNFETVPTQYDEVTPSLRPEFDLFSLSPEAYTRAAGYPPVQVHFGKMLTQGNDVSLLSQKVGSVTTDKPLLFVRADGDKKLAVMAGEGLWRWRLHEYSRYESTEAFDELFGKLLQYLSTSEDKRKFRSAPVQQEFSEQQSVVFESQVYNAIYEAVFGNTIELELTNEQGKKTGYSYVLGPDNSRYEIGGLPEGVYKYRASTTINNQREEVRGEFLVTAQQIELQNLAADFDLLRKLAAATGGKFYQADQMDDLQREFTTQKASGVIRSEEKFDSVINLKFVFIVLLLLFCVEWFLRKYFGSY